MIRPAASTATSANASCHVLRLNGFIARRALRARRGTVRVCFDTSLVIEQALPTNPVFRDLPAPAACRVESAEAAQAAGFDRLQRSAMPATLTSRAGVAIEGEHATHWLARVCRL